MVDRSRLIGLRRVAPRRTRARLRLLRGDVRYEVRFVDWAWVRDRVGVDELLGRRQLRADIPAALAEADRLWDTRDGSTFVECPTGRHIPGPVTRHGETFSARGPWIVSSSGYRVRATGRAGMDYADAEGDLRIDSEGLAIKAFQV